MTRTTLAADPPGREPGPESDPVLFAFINEVGILEQLARNRFERNAPGGMRLSQFVLLNHLARTGDGRTPAEIARALQLTKGAITNTLQRLEAESLVSVVGDQEDARRKRVFLTGQGRAMRRRLVEHAEAELGQVWRDIDPLHVEAMLPLLRSLRRALDRDRD